MGRRPDPVEAVRGEGAEHFAFLVTDEGFDAPVPTRSGLAFHRADVTVAISFGHLNFRDPEVSTYFEPPAEDRAPRRRISLADVYIARGLGTAQDVPGGAQTRRALSKHLAIQAQVLRRLLAFLAAQEDHPAPSSWFHS